MKRRWVILVVLLVIIVIGAIVFGVSQVATPPAAPANLATIKRGDISASINATGKVVSKKMARLALPMSGMVQAINKQEGDLVKLGDVILSLRADDSQRRVRQLELNLQSRQLDLARAKAAPRDEDIQVAQANVSKATIYAAAAESAYTSSPTAQNDAARQATRLDLDIARANFNRLMNGPTQDDLTALQNAITNAQIDLDTAKIALAQTQLTAPYTSTVTEITTRPGELVGGFNPIVTVADLTALQISADIDEIDVANVAVSQTVEVRLDAFPGQIFSGRVARLFPAASTARGSTVYTAVIDFDPGKFLARLGMGANLKIITVDKKGVLIAPNRALKNVGTRKAIHVVAPGDPRDVIVEIGVTDGNTTEIVSGVNEGDQVSVQ